jgi:glyceraldehyde 3-phosphate dehydrogenase
MISIGINGLGRIGKCIFIQLIHHKFIKIKAINIPNFNINNLEFYLRNDSNHKINVDFTFEIIDSNTFSINNSKIKLLNSRDPKNLNWTDFSIDYVIDATGVFLTQETAKQHNVPYVIMCAPSKDSTPQFIVNGNEDKYNGQNIVSNASCTTNCIVPVLKFLNDNYQVKKVNFTTIHSATASQKTNDTTHFKSRTSRSIFNNIIPHTTGASKSVFKILPELKDKVIGTSLRVPTSNVSIVDMNVTLEKNIIFSDLIESLINCKYIETEDNAFKVSSDYNSTKCPSIIDLNASMDLGDNEFKLMIWYDNEWSYSSQVIKLLETMHNYNNKKNNNLKTIKETEFKNKKVILRLDWNVPIKNGIIQDYFRIKSSLHTISYILEQKPEYICIISHLGRPKEYCQELSWKTYIKQINSFINMNIEILENGLSNETIQILNKSTQKSKIYLLENIRFHKEETIITEKSEYLTNIFNNLGNIFVNDAFGCSHRNHMSINGFRNKNNFYYGFLIEKEICQLDTIVYNNDKKVLAIIGGGKMDDKIPLLQNLSKKVDGIYIAGGNINSIIKDNKYKEIIRNIIDSLDTNSEIYMMKDGICSTKRDNNGYFKSKKDLLNDEYFFDIGMESIIELNNIIQEYDIIFWNGTLGLVENSYYKNGSICLLNILKNSGKKIIIGGGDTANFVNRELSNTDSIGYISTGGGASIEYLSKGSLIGIR